MRAAILALAVLPLLLFALRYPFPVRLPLMLQTARDLAAAAALLAAATLLGARLLRLLRLRDALRTEGERLLTAAAIGYGALGLLARAAAAAGALRPAPLALGAVAIAAWGAREAGPLAADLRACPPFRRRPGPAGGVRRLLTALLGVAMALMLLEALAPPTAFDALRYHLRLPRLYADHGGWIDVPYDFNSAFPQNVDMLFAIAFVFGAPAAAGLTHLLLGWLAAGAVALLARRVAGEGAGLPAAAIFYTMPVVAFNSAWAYVDMGVALHLLLAIAAVARFREGGDRRAAVLAGILCGLALGSKYTAAVAIPVVAAAAAAAPRRVAGPGRRRALAAAALVVVVALAVAAPWLLRNWVVRGNPVYPFAASWFGSPPGDTYRASLHRVDLERPEIPSASIRDWLLLPWRFTMAPWVRDEMIGPALLVSVPACGLAGGLGGAGLLLLALACGVIWAALSPQARLYLHGLGLIAAASGAAWRRILAGGGIAARIGGPILVGAVAISVANLAVAQRAMSDPFQVVAGMESPDRYLARKVEGHAAIEFINQRLPAGSKVLFVGEIFGYHCRRPYLLGSKFDTPPIVDYISRAADLDAFRARLRREGFTHVLYSLAQLRRFAELPERYLDWPDERSRAIYRDFMTAWLEPVFSDDEAVVSRILDEPRRTPHAPSLDSEAHPPLSSIHPGIS